MATLKIHYRNATFADAIAAHRLDEAETVFGWTGGRNIGARRYGSLIRDTIEGIGSVYIKRYDYPWPIARYRLSGSRAYREWVNSVRMAQLGLDQPETIVAATRVSRLGVTGSFLMTREVPASRSLEEVLGDPESPPDDELVDRLAAGLIDMIRKLHAGDLCHWDLKLRNVIVSQPGDGLVLIPIDAVNGRRMQIWNRWHRVRRDYRYLLRNERLGPRIAAKSSKKGIMGTRKRGSS